MQSLVHRVRFIGRSIDTEVAEGLEIPNQWMLTVQAQGAQGEFQATCRRHCFFHIDLFLTKGNAWQWWFITTKAERI
jgi:hypothetical protein